MMAVTGGFPSPVMRSFDVLFGVSRISCCTNRRVAGDLRYLNGHVT